KTKTVKVYSNAEQVELFLNGRSLGKKGNATGQALIQPPRIWSVAYEPGVLKAVAQNSQSTCADERRTAGAAARIALESSKTQVRSGDREDLAELTASIVDEAGTIVPGSHLPISFTSYGPGELLPQTWPGHPTGFTWNAVAGLTRILFRPTERV